MWFFQNMSNLCYHEQDVNQKADPVAPVSQIIYGFLATVTLVQCHVVTSDTNKNFFTIPILYMYP